MVVRDHLHFALEAFILRGIANHEACGDFQNDFTAADHIVSTVDVTHPPAGKMRSDLETVKLIADLQHAVDYSIAGLFCYRLIWLKSHTCLR